MKNKIFVNPSLYIGLGKTGTKVILGVKSLYIKQYGEIPPNISFLCFDDDTSSLNESFIEINYNKLLQDGYHQNVTEKIYLTTDEIIDISYDFNKIEIIDFIKKNNIDWLDETILNQLPRDYNSKNNSIVYRQLKRLGFFINYKTFNNSLCFSIVCIFSVVIICSWCFFNWSFSSSIYNGSLCFRFTSTGGFLSSFFSVTV